MRRTSTFSKVYWLSGMVIVGLMATGCNGGAVSSIYGNVNINAKFSFTRFSVWHVRRPYKKKMGRVNGKMYRALKK